MSHSPLPSELPPKLDAINRVIFRCNNNIRWAIVVVCAAYLITNAWVVGSIAGPTGSLLGACCCMNVGVTRSYASSIHGMRNVDGHWQIDADPTIGDGAFGATPGTIEKVAIVYHSHRRKHTGIWTPIIETRDDTIVVTDAIERSPMPAGSQRDAIIIAYASQHDRIFASEGSVRMKELLAGGKVHYRILWLGVLNDISVLAVMFVLVRTALWLRRPWQSLAQRRVAAQQCVACGYAVAGLSVCPECGEVVSR